MVDRNTIRNPLGIAGWGVSQLRVAAAVVVVLCLASSAVATIVKDQGEVTGPDPRLVFAALAQAWQEGDEQALADLVQVGGLRVTTGGDYERFTQYSPSQAFYYFRNLFQTHGTVSFDFEHLQDASVGERIHGLAVWQYSRPGVESLQKKKLVFVLTQHEDIWRLAEINPIR